MINLLRSQACDLAKAEEDIESFLTEYKEGEMPKSCNYYVISQVFNECIN